MASFKQLTWKQHVAYLGCAAGFALSLAVYQGDRGFKATTLTSPSSEAIVVSRLQRTVKRLRDRIASPLSDRSPRSSRHSKAS